METEHHHHHEHWKPKRSVRDCTPLIVIVLIAALSAFAGQWAARSGESFMRQFMGMFLVIFAMLKLFDLRGFAEGFQMYDLVAKRFRPYALVYPFIELGLGLSYQANLFPALTNLALLVVMLIGAAGVLWALHRSLDVACACLSGILEVPLSTVAIVEDVGMAAMAAVMLVLNALC